LNWKVQKVEEKLKFLEERKEQIARGEHPNPWGGRGGRGGRGRGCWGQEQQPMMAQPQGEQQLPPECSVTPTPSPTFTPNTFPV
jgi:hypothetical protein